MGLLLARRDDPRREGCSSFPCTLKTIGEAYRYAFQTWLPDSGYQRADGPDFEHYDESFEPEVEGSQLRIYVPIKQL